jgi:exosortase/archaeosortase family protein
VLTDTPRGPTNALKFVLCGVAASLGFFGLLRLNWTEAHIVLPLTRAQSMLAVGLLGAPSSPVVTTLACSGTDALALCLGAILAYPVPWRTRLAGTVSGAALILGLNTLRIGTLGRVASLPALFNALHVYVWPGVLTFAIAGYVFMWMRLADRRDMPSREDSDVSQALRASPSPDPAVRPAPQPSRRFVLLAVAFLLLFVAASPFYLQSPRVLALAGFIARAAAAILGVAGISANAAANVLWTASGGFVVTQECISTPLIPVYVAAVCAYAKTWPRLILGVLSALPLFIGLGIVRLLVVALPGVLVSPMFLVHAFYQLLSGAVVVFLAAAWRHGGRGALGHALTGVIVGILFVYLLGPFYTRLITYQAGVPAHDPQGAIALLPTFQIGLYLALWVAAFVAVGWSRFLAGLAVLGLTQTAGLVALHALASYSDLTAHVRDVRGWAVAGPVLIFAAVVNGAKPRR